jgi:glucose-6-phosphate 1-dehydrogenase
MWPHLFSLLTLTLETANLSTILSSLEDLDNVKIEQVFLGQYATYCDEAGLEDSTTETFFKIKLNIDEAEIIMESGKNLPTKITEIELTVEKNQNETKKMIWNIYPQQTLTLLNEQSTESFDNFDKQINRQTKFLADLSNSRLDQTNLFELLLNNEKQHFVTPEKISQSWKIWQKIVNFIATNQIKIQVYQDQTMPKTD